MLVSSSRRRAGQPGIAAVLGGQGCARTVGRIDGGGDRAVRARGHDPGDRNVRHRHHHRRRHHRRPRLRRSVRATAHHDEQARAVRHDALPVRPSGSPTAWSRRSDDREPSAATASGRMRRCCWRPAGCCRQRGDAPHVAIGDGNPSTGRDARRGLPADDVRSGRWCSPPRSFPQPVMQRLASLTMRFRRAKHAPHRSASND